ncbi:molybdate ABC transporter substrate-binding protein [Tabrizicola sp.]|uniref:molybdate ABC transporter substrate-binding protein n=1 Tax=Tabrizicola sp. TaxID=2005166 RepID=UPI003D2C5FBE
MPRRFGLAALMGLSLAAPARAEEVVVFAAASLKTALDEIAAEFRAETGHEVVISYAGSNHLAQQILQGAPADIFLSSAVNWMDVVEAAGLVVPGQRRDLLGNRLVLIAHGTGAAAVNLEPGFDLAGLLGDGWLSMAMVDAVPAGQYGKAALQALGLWEAVAPQVAQSENVRAALALVATGEAPYGIVYASDAVAGEAVTVVAEFPEGSHAPIVFPAALLTGAADAADAAFLNALSSEAADATFAAQGFKILN